jgi:nucleotide-binding universal stress UspA family protein
MNDYPSLLIALQSGQPSHPALEYGVSLAGLFRSPVTVLGVTKTGAAPRLEARINAAREELADSGISCEIVWDQGSFERALLRCLADHPDRLTLFSDLHKPIWGRYVLVGRFRRLMAAVSSPLLRVQRPCLPPRRILVCSGGLAYTIPLEKLCVQIAAAASAQVTIFHVVEPVTLDYPLSREVRAHWAELLKTDTPQARHLQSALRAAQNANVEARVLVRHGPLIHELFDEIRTGEYDLVAVGSAYSSRTLRHLTRPDVAALVAANFDCPVLTARGKISDTYG